MKTSSVFSLVLILCYLCRAQKHSADDDILLRAPNDESGKEKAPEETAPTQSPGADSEGGEQEMVLQADIWAELRRLRDMVVGQEVQLEHLTGRVTAAESLVEALQRENTAMEARMTAAERLAGELQMENDAQAAELADAQQRLTVSEGRVDELEKQQEAQATDLAAAQQMYTVSERRMKELEKQQQAQATELAVAQQKLTVSEGRVEELKIQQEAQAAELALAQQKLTVSEGRVEELEKQQEVTKLAFSASLLTSDDGKTSSIEDFTPLIYKNVFTNIGNHYNEHTGFFTAPVRGVYYFRFTGHAAHSEYSMGLRLFKNAHFTVTAADHIDTNLEDNASNGVVLQLEVGDVVSVQLRGEVWDDHYHRTTFSGFLLFTL